MAEKFFEDKIPHNGMTYNEYFEQWKKELEENKPNDLDEEGEKFYNYRKMNMQRTKRVDKTYHMSEGLKKIINSIEKPQLWMVLTEDWCGDSAQNLPYVALIAKENSNINLRILQRDKHLDIIDKYLTNGKSRSIPKVVAFDKEGNELFQWGPRPQAAQQFVKDELAKGREKPDVYQDLHLWYGRNRGDELEKEFINILSGLN